MRVVSLSISVTTLTVNGLNSPTKRERFTEWIKNTCSNYMLPTENLFYIKDTNRLKEKCWKKIFQANTNQKRTGVAILLSDKIHFESTKGIRDKEGHYMLIKVSLQQEDITVINTYLSNDRPSKYMKLTELKGEIVLQ